jgi:hypothetical protein
LSQVWEMPAIAPMAQNRRRAEQRDELAAPHSITSSGDGEQRRRHGQSEYPGGLVVDDELELARLHDRQVRGLLVGASR